MRQDVETQEIVCPGGMPAYVARPAATGRVPVVVLMHERYGLVAHTRDLARRCAADFWRWRRISFSGIRIRRR
jgi:dienelactone hydrolase